MSVHESDDKQHYQCYICRMNCRGWKGLRVHLGSVHKMNAFEAQCDHCGKEFCSRTRYLTHLKVVSASNENCRNENAQYEINFSSTTDRLNRTFASFVENNSIESAIGKHIRSFIRTQKISYAINVAKVSHERIIWTNTWSGILVSVPICVVTVQKRSRCCQ